MPSSCRPAARTRASSAFPWGHGVVFTRITRRQFASSGLGEAIEPHLVICADQLHEGDDAERLQHRLWAMFPHAFGSRVFFLPQIDRARWIMFPQVRVQTQGALFDDQDVHAQLPDILRAMDLQQEQLARSLGDGHRVIHGVAGSGKTMILGYRAEVLAKAAGPGSKPVLVLCTNEPAGREAGGHGAGTGAWRSGACAPLPQVVPPAAGGFRPAPAGPGQAGGRKPVLRAGDARHVAVDRGRQQRRGFRTQAASG